ncbi:MAG: deoxyribonuclease IV [Gaiellaceae bacterium]
MATAPVVAGAHVSSGGGIYRAVERAVALDADALQLFTQSPRAWRPTNHAGEALERFRIDRLQAGIEAVVCHALYLINLANPDPVIYEKSRTALNHTVEVATAIEADAVVLHVGSHLGHGLEAALPQVSDALLEALALCGGPTWLLLENSAGAGGTIGRSIAELATIINYLDIPPRLGVCLDSCHLFVSGVDVGDRAELDKLISELDTSIGLERLRCLHVNDAKAALGSNRDRHANLLEGELGERLATFLTHEALSGLPAILETPGAEGKGADAAEVAKLRDLARSPS